MILMEKILQEKKRELESLIKQIESRQAQEPKGRLRIVRDRKHYSYYHCTQEEKAQYPSGRYISKADKELIYALAQKDYDAKVLAWAKECYEKMGSFMEVYRDGMCAGIYEKMRDIRKEWVTPYEWPEDLCVERWMSKPYVGKEIPPEKSFFMTEKGEKVRSKSEKILADKFYNMGIPYKYEHPLKLKGYGTVHPDFTLLNRRTRQVWYWEHLGMMDNPDYAQKAIDKINTYAQNKIIPGKSLLLSFECQNKLNMGAIEALILECLK